MPRCLLRIRLIQPFALLAEAESLHEQLRQLTASGHELISTQARVQSLPQRATDAIIQFQAGGSVSGFASVAEMIFDVAEIEVLHHAASQLFEMPKRFHDNVPGFPLDDVRRVPDQPAAERELVSRDCSGALVMTGRMPAPAPASGSRSHVRWSGGWRHHQR